MRYEFLFEKLYVHNSSTISKNLKWFNSFKNKKYSLVKKNLFQLKDWNYDMRKGIIFHQSKKFFTIEGLSIKRANREIENWEQPFIKQVGYRGGIIGLIRCKFKDIPHYLVQAKFEPGNFGLIQLSPTIQATHSNLEKIHGGTKNPFLNIFKSKYSKTIIKKNVSEDGGRFLKKTNIHWIINYDGPKIKLIKSYKWITYAELDELIRYKTIVNPHLRAIVSLL